MDDKHVYVLFHVHYSREGDPWAEEDIKLIGVYRTEELAKAAVERLGTRPGFRDHPHLTDPLVDDYRSGFTLDRYKIDEDNWSDGFGFAD